MSSVYNISHSTVHIHECNCNNSRGLTFIVPQMSTGAYLSTGPQMSTGAYLSTGPQMSTGAYLSTGPQMSTDSCCSTGTCWSNSCHQVSDNMEIEIDNNDNLI
jgi:hypothetical protein